MPARGVEVDEDRFASRRVDDVLGLDIAVYDRGREAVEVSQDVEHMKEEGARGVFVEACVAARDRGVEGLASDKVLDQDLPLHAVDGGVKGSVDLRDAGVFEGSEQLELALEHFE